MQLGIGSTFSFLAGRLTDIAVFSGQNSSSGDDALLI